MPRLSNRAHRRRVTLVQFVVFVVVTGTLTAFLAAQLGRIGTGGGTRFEATFEDVSGLSKGDQVKIAGASVGRVSSISVEDGRARVRLSVDSDVAARLPADTEAAIRWRDPLFQRVVYLIPGTSPAKIRPDAHITRTRSVVDIGELVNRIGPLTRGLNPDQVNLLLTSVSQALEGNEANTALLVRNIDQIASTISARRQTVKQMLADYNTVTGVLARRDKQIGQMIDNLVKVTGAFTTNRGLVDAALVQLGSTAATTDKLVSGNADQLAALLEKLTTVTAGARHNVGTLGKLLETAVPKAQRIFSMTDNGRFITLAVPCITIGPRCPFPLRLPGSQEGVGRLRTSQDLQRLLVGGR